MIKELETAIGYRFRNITLLQNALTHSSYANERWHNSLLSNERLEFLGDSVLGMLDYRTIGGTQFLGIKKPVIKAHGSSDALAFRNAIRQAEEAAKADFSAELEQSLKALAAAKENADD